MCLSYDKPRQCVEKQRHYFADKGPYSQIYDFALWELDHKEGWRLKNWCFQTVVLEKTLENHWTARRWNQSIPKEINCEYSLEYSNDAETEAPILWPPDTKSRLIGKDPDAGKDGGQEEKGTTKDEMVGWHHRLNGHEFEQTLGDGEGQGSLACSSPWGHKELGTTEQLKLVFTLLKWCFQK